MKKASEAANSSASDRLQELASAALETCKTARRHGLNLGGDNFYANKLAGLRADATNAFRLLSSKDGSDPATLAALIETVFAANTAAKDRVLAVRQLGFALKTSWQSSAMPREDEGLFPLSILTKANRGYLAKIGRQMNGCFTSDWHDAAAVMMRRLVEIAIIEAFEGKGIATKIKDSAGNYYQLSDLVARTLAETSWTLSRNAKKALPALRDVGHMSAHGRYFTAHREDLESLKSDCRIVVEELLHHAGLL